MHDVVTPRAGAVSEERLEDLPILCMLVRAAGTEKLAGSGRGSSLDWIGRMRGRSESDGHLKKLGST